MTPVPGDGEDAPNSGTALCLSGGGFRAMLFHCGVLIRLGELGMLPRLRCVSSVSGGSIVAGLLGLRWRRLMFDADGVAANLRPEVIEPLREFARHTIDRAAILTGFLPGFSAPARVAAVYRRCLFGDATLQDLPDAEAGEAPRFVINATNVQSGALFRFSRAYAADYRVGRTLCPRFSLAEVVAASSAFPPFFSPAVISLAGVTWVAGEGELVNLRGRAVLTDGGVYDNLGIEAAWKNYATVLVSDAGQRMLVDDSPATLWGRHTVRVLGLIDNQVRSLRKRQLIDSFSAGERAGVYLGIRSELGHYPAAPSLYVEPTRALEVAAQPTRLRRILDSTQARIINWGYAVCDMGMRAHMPGEVTARTAEFPYPGGV
jgi:NTE family protein